MSALVYRLKESVQHYPLKTPEETWAFYLSLAERLCAYGEPSEFLIEKGADNKAKLSLWVEGFWLSGSDVNEEPSYPVLAGSRFPIGSFKKMENAASWSGVDAESLGFAKRMWSERLSLEIERWVRAPCSFDKGSPFLTRLQSAYQQGWDVAKIWYHETEELNVPGILDRGFLLSKVESRVRDTHMPEGVFVKPDPTPIEVAEDPVQIPIILKKANVFSFDTRESIEDYYREHSEYTEVISAIGHVNNDYDARCDVLLKKKNTAEVRAQTHSVIEEWRALLNPLAAKARVILQTHLLSQGFSQVDVYRDKGSHGRTVHSRITFNPDDVMPAVNLGMPSRCNVLQNNAAPWIDACSKLQQHWGEYSEHLTKEQWCISALSLNTGLSHEDLKKAYDDPSCIGPKISEVAKASMLEPLKRENVENIQEVAPSQEQPLRMKL